MASIITVGELPASMQSAEMVDLMVAGVNAQASRVAPCLVDTTTPPTTDQLDEARLVLFGALKRWIEAGSGALQQEGAGIFTRTIDTRQRGGWKLRPDEIEQLQDICKGEEVDGPFAVDTVPVSADWSTYTPLDSTTWY